jgi:hypothetical protein
MRITYKDRDDGDGEIGNRNMSTTSTSSNASVLQMIKFSETK